MSIFAKRNFDEFKQAAKILTQRWEIKEELNLINDSENIVYYLKDNNEFVVRLTENRHKTHDQINSELDFINFINQRVKGITSPILSKNYNLIETLHFQGKVFHVSVFKKAKGAAIENGNFINTALATNIGELSGNLHYFSKQYRPNSPRYDFIDSDHLKNAHLYTQRTDLLKARDKVVKWYNSLPKNTNSFGLIHGDIHYGNFFYDIIDGITLFDFDDCSNSFFIHEIGLHLWYAKGMHLRYKNDEHFENYKKQFLQSYKSKIDLDPRWYDLVDDFFHFRTIEVYLWVHKMFDFLNLSHQQAQSIKKFEERILYMKDKEYKRF